MDYVHVKMENENFYDFAYPLPFLQQRDVMAFAESVSQSDVALYYRHPAMHRNVQLLHVFFSLLFLGAKRNFLYGSMLNPNDALQSVRVKENIIRCECKILHLMQTLKLADHRHFSRSPSNFLIVILTPWRQHHCRGENKHKKGKEMPILIKIGMETFFVVSKKYLRFNAGL